MSDAEKKEDQEELDLTVPAVVEGLTGPDADALKVDPTPEPPKPAAKAKKAKKEVAPAAPLDPLGATMEKLSINGRVEKILTGYMSDGVMKHKARMVRLKKEHPLLFKQYEAVNGQKPGKVPVIGAHRHAKK